MQMQSEGVSAWRGWRWIVEAMQLFRRSALIWIVLNLVLIFIASALMLIPFLGPILFALITPVFMAGLIDGAHELDRGGQLEIAHLFRGFQRGAAQLVTIGGVYVVGQLFIGAVVGTLGGADLQNAMNSAVDTQTNQAVPPVSSNRVAVALLAGAALFVPLAMAVWFAPALVVFDGVPALGAMKASINACVKNFAAMLVYGLGMAALLFGLFFILRIVFTVIPQGIPLLRNFAAMVMFLVWVALAIISVYTSYRDVFRRTGQAAAANSMEA
jgi:hypothetical protein